MVHAYLYPLWAKLSNQGGEKGGSRWVGRLPCSAQSVCEEGHSQVGIFLKSCANGTDQVVFCLANVEGTKINSVLGFCYFFLDRVSKVDIRLAECVVSHVPGECLSWMQGWNEVLLNNFTLEGLHDMEHWIFGALNLHGVLLCSLFFKRKNMGI